MGTTTSLSMTSSCLDATVNGCARSPFGRDPEADYFTSVMLLIKSPSAVRRRQK